MSRPVEDILFGATSPQAKLTTRVMNVILAIVLIFSIVVMASNLLVDISYPLLDPRAAAKKTEDE